MATPLWGATIYEFRMQARRRSVWITTLGFAAALVALTASSTTWKTYSHERSALIGFADVASLIMLLMPVAIGVLLADRLPRDRTTKSEETLETLPVSFGARLAGKYLGAAAATLLPVLIIYCAGVVYLLALRGRDLAALPLATLPFLAVVLPGVAFVAAFAVACPIAIPTPLYQLLFIGYWFWGNLVQINNIPTLNGTLVTPAGDYMLAGYFGADGNGIRHATAMQATASIAILAGLGVCALVSAWLIHRWQRARA
jgi:ABC-type Na+ efflux pump permease subunit